MDLKVVLIKPSKYSEDGSVERFWRGFMPNSTLNHMYSMTLAYKQETGADIEVSSFDEYVQDRLDYLQFVKNGAPTLVALVGVQSHQFHRALDLAALARREGALVVIGGPHAMTCDTSAFQNRGVSFALAEGELIWERILRDAACGELQPVYGRDQRWQRELDSPVLVPPSPSDLRRYVVPMLGIYPARGCPFLCNFCSVIKIAGRNVRSESIETTLSTLRNAKRAGVKLVMFTTDNFNKMPAVRKLLSEMSREKIGLPFFAQCDSQIGDRDSDLIPLLSEAGCFQVFVGVESFSRQALRGAKKYQNHPEHYARIVKLCRRHGIRTHFSNIIGFPEDTEEGILEHVNTLRRVGPTFSSFYILTPIPGTEQYDDFRAESLIFESNLDRFDGTWPTWRHKNLTPQRLRRLLFECYRRFYSVAELFNRRKVSNGLKMDALAALLFARLSALRRTHPMSGGVWRFRRDHMSQYLKLRKETFGIESVPLPDSLGLSASDEAYNRHAKLLRL